MSEESNGGPAFPHDVFVKDEQGVSHLAERHFGMTLRDYFAGQALAGLVDKKWTGETKDDRAKRLASATYMIADAMLIAREVQS